MHRLSYTAYLFSQLDLLCMTVIMLKEHSHSGHLLDWSVTWLSMMRNTNFLQDTSESHRNSFIWSYYGTITSMKVSFQQSKHNTKTSKAIKLVLNVENQAAYSQSLLFFKHHLSVLGLGWEQPSFLGTLKGSTPMEKS